MSPIYLSMRGLTRGIQPESIVGVRSAGNYSEVWLEDGAMVLDSRALGVWLALLPRKIFFQIHRTAIVSALHVMDVDRRNADKWLVRMRSLTRSEEHTSELQSLMRISYAVFCLKKKTKHT